MAELGHFRTFVSRPDIVVPLLDVTIHDAAAVQPGYLLYAPHYQSTVDNLGGTFNRSRLQSGPYIFDTAGELAWSGAHLRDWDFVNDFKYHPWGEFSLLEGGTLKTISPNGARPMILNSSLQSCQDVHLPASISEVNPHDLQLADEGSTLVVERSIANEEPAHGGIQTIQDHLYQIDRHSGQIIFSWNLSDHIPTPRPRVIDLEGFAQITEIHFLRVNSVDRTSEGDFFISGRGTNTVYLVSGKDGSILWRLGGSDSPYRDFVRKDFNFSAQHDARMLHANESGISLVSFLDNASDGYDTSSPTSSDLVVALNHTDHTASLVTRLARPDGGISDRRGNVQALSQGSYLVCWSQSGWVTEFDRDGRNIFDIRFKDENMYTYRAYKVVSSTFDSLKSPEVPAIQAFTQDSVRISAYVSWNGGFGVTEWRLFGCSGILDIIHNSDVLELSMCEGKWSLLTEMSRQGFETRLDYVSEFTFALVYAEAVDKSGVSIAQSRPIVLRKTARKLAEAGSTGEENSLEAPLASYTSRGQSHAPTKATSIIVKTTEATATTAVLHGLYKIVRGPASDFFGWITWILLGWCIILASASVILSFRCIYSNALTI